jgi:AraC family transcriptional regulator, regulatory protein of adaptative response / methylphosphotriester-DNA alkyltransferase methyltransferase
MTGKESDGDPEPAGPHGARGRRLSTQEARLAIFDEASAIVEAEFSTSALRIDEVARRVATSPRQLQRIFSEVEGVGFRSHLRHVRMSRAAALLHSTDVPVKEVARDVGYGDPSQFAKTFRRTYGVSPSEARAKGGS